MSRPVHRRIGPTEIEEALPDESETSHAQTPHPVSLSHDGGAPLLPGRSVRLSILSCALAATVAVVVGALVVFVW
jgi:hypothetical protein